MFRRSKHKSLVLHTRAGRRNAARAKRRSLLEERERIRGKRRLIVFACLATVLFYGVPLPQLPIAAMFFDETFHELPTEHTVISMPSPEAGDMELIHPGENVGGVIGACPAPPSPDDETFPAAPMLSEAPPQPGGPCVVEELVSAGDTLSGILDPYIVPGELQKFIDAGKEYYDFTNIRVGKTYRITTVEGRLHQFVYEKDGRGLLIIERKGDDFVAGHIPIVYDIKTETVAGSIESSLLGSMYDIGEKPEIALRLAEIFSCDVDFIRDIRKGDSFKALVKKRYLDGDLVGYSDILAAEFVNQGRTYKGFFFTDSEGNSDFYDAEGNSLRKSFLKAPLAFTRVTSGFNMRRKHPITGKVRPHPAVDYGAPNGTPVMAVCDGTVKYRGWGNGAGNYIKLSHPQGYESMYLHLSKFASNLAKGKKVRQGDVIGYVGSTGMSTGPHLDFRMKRNGEWINPTKMVNIKGKTLDKKYLKKFKEAVAQRSAMLQSGLANHMADDSGAAQLPVDANDPASVDSSDASRIVKASYSMTAAQRLP